MRCVLISTDDDLAELRSLVSSLGYDVAEEYVQRRDSPDPKYFIGSGKVEEIAEAIAEIEGVDVAIFNARLKPSQQCTLEKSLGVPVWDRLWLILEIFVDRAHSKEARLQVELARLHYEIPMLKEWVHRVRHGEHPGFMTGGEYQVDRYLELSRKRERHIKGELESVIRQREVRRSYRKDREFHLIGLAGYTNSGKSTLLKALTGAEVTIEDRLFSTLSTTTRKIAGLERPVLLTDTVGFIRDLPPWLIEAFRSTLEEVFLADTILLVFDLSDPVETIIQKLGVSRDILYPETPPSRIILAANKADALPETEVRARLEALSSNPFNITPVPISAKTGAGLTGLVDAILSRHVFPVEMRLLLVHSQASERFINWLYQNARVLSRGDGDAVEIRLGCTERDAQAIQKRVGEEELGNTVIIKG